MEELQEIDEKQAALVAVDRNSDEFTKYVEERDKWLSTPIASNTTLAQNGYPFTIIAATQRDFEATELDTSRGFKLGDLVPKIAYLCRSQMTWWSTPDNAEDVEFKKDENFIILLNSNPVRLLDFERMINLLTKGPVFNVALEEIPQKVKGFNPAHKLVAAQSWKALE